MQAHTSNKDISISARRLAEIIHRDGGLATPTYAGIDSLEGIKIHQKFTQYLKKQNYIFNCSELSLHSKYTSEKLNLKISGRLDNLSFSQDSIKLYEIKSFRGHSMFLPDKGDPLHWAQLKIYAYLLKKSDPQLIAKKLKTNDNRLFKKMMDSLKKDSIKLNLVYIAIDHHEIIIKEEIFSWQEINEFMQDTCEQYLIRMHNIISWQNLRNQAARESKFPFEHLRDGQAEMMRQTLATMRDKGVLLAQAPTGIGKTMAVLYPSLKALSTNYVQRIFYATAMIATRDIARQSLEILRENGFLIRSILLQAKEKICTQPDLFCDQSLCPFAVDYYQRLPDGIQALLPLQNISPEIIREVALKYQLCPHELSLDFSYFCDLIIGDYNHIFDPQAKLSGFFENPDEQTAILVDEAHNLPSRATTMYSAGIS
ncbi:MAG TPA: DEAD/DEAH box helicase, partial [Candidatus Eisenbacteria bacterium]|nr:DEAD/DEAH box helicase [Candidatus Eisenbacteria bacterium]